MSVIQTSSLDVLIQDKYSSPHSQEILAQKRLVFALRPEHGDKYSDLQTTRSLSGEIPFRRKAKNTSPIRVKMEKVKLVQKKKISLTH